MFRVADDVNPVIAVSAGEKLNLRCSQSPYVETTWYRNDAELRRTNMRIRPSKQSLKFKYVEADDAGVYACRLESDEAIKWRNVTVLVVHQRQSNEAFGDVEGEVGEETSGVMDTLRPEEESNDLEIEGRSE